MSHMAAGLAEELLIQLLDAGVLVRFPQLHLGVGPVQALGPERPKVGEVPDGSGLEGLTAAVDTAAGACEGETEVLSFTCQVS